MVNFKLAWVNNKAIIIFIFIFLLYSQMALASTNLTTTSENLNFNTDMFVIITIVLIVIILLIWEPISLDLIALSIPFILVLLQPWTKVSAEDALSGFSSKATITILAMFILSKGVYQTGVVQILGEKILKITGENERGQLAITTSLSGFIAGAINNTPLVAILIPMVSELARKTRISPSKLLIPISYAAMMGGMLTLFGTSTNILASEVSDRLLDHAFSMFEFTHLGIILLIIGLIYLIFFSNHLIPERINPDEKLTEEYEMSNFLTEVVIQENSTLIGKNIDKLFEKSSFDINLVQLIRDGKKFVEPFQNMAINPGDHLIIRTDDKTLIRFVKNKGVEILPGINVTTKQLEEGKKGQSLVEVVIPHGSILQGKNLAEIDFLNQYSSTILAIRHAGQLSHMKMEDRTLKAGDVLLLMIGKETLKRMRNNQNFIIISEIEPSDYRQDRLPVAIGIIASVIFFAALGIIPLVISAIGGILAMVVTGCLKPGEVYDAVNWDVIFMLAGLIPLGIAMEETGTAQFIARKIVDISANLSPLLTLGLFYLLTVILTNIISNNASVILMIPVAVDAAMHIGANPFAFVLVVTFAASSAFLTPVGYQTNLMVYGPGGYHFKDFIIAGAPLQLIMTITCPFLISIFWGL